MKIPKKYQNKMEELKNIKVMVRWGKNGRKYVYANPTPNTLSKYIKRYGIEQICDGCLWLYQ